MAPHLLTMSAEIRLNIWKLVLQDGKLPIFITAQTGNWVEDVLFFDEIICEKHFGGAIAWKGGPTSIVFTCKQLAAEVLPLFWKHVRVQFEAEVIHWDIWYGEMGLRAFEMGDFMKTPKQVQELSISRDLGEYLAQCYDRTEDPNVYVENILPNLARLIIYEEQPIRHNWDLRKRNEEDMYEACEINDWDLCYFIFPERDNTIIHQLLLGNGFVCLATLAPGLDWEDFVYEFRPEYEALVSLDDMASAE